MGHETRNDHHTSEDHIHYGHGHEHDVPFGERPNTLFWKNLKRSAVLALLVYFGKCQPEQVEAETRTKIEECLKSKPLPLETEDIEDCTDKDKNPLREKPRDPQTTA